MADQASDIANLQALVAAQGRQISALKNIPRIPPSTPAPVSTVTNSATVQAPFWTGVWIPRTAVQGSAMPLLAGNPDPTVDWDPAFADGVTYPHFALSLPTAEGEVGYDFLADVGDIRHTINLNVTSVQTVVAQIFAFCGAGNPVNGAIQIKVNGVIQSISMAPGTVINQNVSFSLSGGKNVISVARSYGIESLFLGVSFFSSSVKWVAP